MTCTISPARPDSIPTSLTATLSHKSPVDDPQVGGAFEEPPPHDVTSNIRHGSPSPDPHIPREHHSSLLSSTREPAIPFDAIYDLPAPDLTPRFVFKVDEPSDDQTPYASTPNGEYELSPSLQPPGKPQQGSSPRIYFGDSAITFVPPFCYDFLERDPSVKSVPRNYRAWTRTGRPKLDVEGLERAEAKRDFLAMGLSYPQDSESEESGDEKEKERRRKRKKKIAARGLMVPIERPRRMVKRITGLYTAPRQSFSMKPVPRQRPKEEKHPSGESVPIVDDPMDGMASKSTENSDSSERRSSSTLLDTDAVDSKSKKKRSNSDQELQESLPAKKQRVSRRLFVRRQYPQDKEESPEPERSVHAQSSLSELTPTPEPRTPANLSRTTSRQDRRRSTSGESHTVPRRTTGEASHSVPTTGGLSRPTQPLASRPGHRVNRDFTTVESRPVELRTFPPSIPIISGYSGFYRRYPFITQFERDDPVIKHIIPDDTQPKRSLGNWNAPRDPRDLYTPRYTKGSGNKKIALCPICYEEPTRGGEGRQEWNHTKTSQHNYHMQYYHGISATRCAPFSPPIAQRTVPIVRPQSNEKPEILQGKCHNCKQWIPLEGCKVGELKVKELFWWKHAASCHKSTKLTGEANIFIEDDSYRLFQEYEAMKGRQS